MKIPVETSDVQYSSVRSILEINKQNIHTFAIELSQVEDNTVLIISNHILKNHVLFSNGIVTNIGFLVLLCK